MSEYKYRVVNGKRVPEHRAVVEELLGITLEEDQVVHHLNGDKTDNRPENRQVMDRREHARLHIELLNRVRNRNRFDFCLSRLAFAQVGIKGYAGYFCAVVQVRRDHQIGDIRSPVVGDDSVSSVPVSLCRGVIIRIA